MNKQLKGLLTVTVLIVFFGLGYLVANYYNQLSTSDINQKPVVDIKEKRDLINEETQIIYEQTYIKCNHIIISEFNDREVLEGKTLDQIRKIYTNANGYNVNLDNGTLIIHQDINDWCPSDKNKCRLKEYQGRVAIYKGPDSEHDVLEKVTSIYMDSLPAEIQEKIRQGAWEFKDSQAINDALENLDEYL